MIRRIDNSFSSVFSIVLPDTNSKKWRDVSTTKRNVM